jgi:hypothetical protein
MSRRKRGPPHARVLIGHTGGVPRKPALQSVTQCQRYDINGSVRPNIPCAAPGPCFSMPMPSSPWRGCMAGLESPQRRTPHQKRVRAIIPAGACAYSQIIPVEIGDVIKSLQLRPSWLLASWADQTEPRLSLPQACTSGLPALKSPRGLPDMTMAPNGELRRQDLHLQVQQLVSLRSLL